MFWSSVILFFLASLIQSGLILLQQRGETLTRRLGRYAFPAYNFVTLVPWAAFVVTYAILQLESHPGLPLSGMWVQALGVLLFLVGSFLAGWVAVLLGPARLNGLRFFDPAIRRDRVLSGPFRLMRNPMYTGFFLVFLGAAFWKDSLYDLAIALESLVLLNGIQAWVENQGLVRTSRSEPH